MKLKFFGNTVLELFDHYVLKMDLDDFVYSKNELQMIKIDKQNMDQVGRAIGNTTKKWIANDYPYAQGYCFKNPEGDQIGSCWIMFKGGDEKLYKIRNHDSFIFRLEVEESFRGRGYSKMIMTDMFQTIRKQGCREVILVCARKNEKALHLYETIGMKKIGRKIFCRVLNKNIPYYEL